MNHLNDRPLIQPPEKTAAKPVWIDRFARDIVLGRLHQIAVGQLELEHDGKTIKFGNTCPDCPEAAAVKVHDTRFFSELLLGGELGAAESFMTGAWSTPNLTRVVQLMIRNMQALDTLQGGLPFFLEPVRRAAHWLNRNTRKGSRQNIVAHYDLGNDFFKLFLDSTMTYSAGIFTSETATMQDASVAKLDRLCHKLALSESDHLLEIGTGWGSMALHAAKHYGCHVTTTTISDQQHDYAGDLFLKEGLNNKITLLKSDYRDLTGIYDKVVSVEMIEAVGHAFYNTYFNTISRLLKPDGMAAIQAITIADRKYDQQRRHVDFIKRYIFPGSCIPSINAITSSIAAATDMRLFHLEDITPHYANTLATWRDTFFSNIDLIRSMGYSEAFIRMWDYYFSYCEGGFLERYIGDVQMVFTKPLCRAAPILPPLEKI
jgi:cyclopropane-fatty-acyl-phospholipid synthase